MKKLLFLAFGLSLLPACRTARDASEHPTPTTVSTNRASQVLANYYEERLKLYPLEATLAGDNRYNDSLRNEITDAFRASEKAFFEKYRSAVGRVRSASLSSEDRLSCDILQ